MNNNSPIFLQKTLSHPNGTTFQLLTISKGNDTFYIEYPSNLKGKIKESRLLLNKIISGLTPSFTYKLELSGIGYKAQTDNNLLVLNLGKAEPIIKEIPNGIKVDVKKSGVEIDITGRWKDEVSLFAHSVLLLKPAYKDKYKHKGIKLIL